VLLLLPGTQVSTAGAVTVEAAGACCSWHVLSEGDPGVVKEQTVECALPRVQEAELLKKHGVGLIGTACLPHHTCFVWRASVPLGPIVLH
jgi:hypothetical protein